MGVLQAELKIKEKEDKWKSAVPLEWLIQHECVPRMNHVTLPDGLKFIQVTKAN